MSGPEVLDAGFVAEVVEHMNADHADAVLNIARHQGERPAAQTARMTGLGVDHLRIAIEEAGRHLDITVPLARAIASPRDVRPVLIQMSRAAREALT